MVTEQCEANACRKPLAPILLLDRVSEDDQSVRGGTSIANRETRHDDLYEISIMYVKVVTWKLILHLNGNQCISLSVREAVAQTLSSSNSS